MKQAIDQTRQMWNESDQRKTKRQELLEKDRIFTLANLLSIVRLFLLPFVLAALLVNRPDYDLIAFGLIIVAGLTDFFDGFMARRMNEISQLGKIIDPVADKLFIAFLGLILILLRGLPVWFVAIFLIRDFLILTVSYLLFLNRDIVISSSFLGKITTAVLLLTLVLYTIRLEEIGLPLVYVSTALVIISGLMMLRNFILLMRQLISARDVAGEQPAESS